MTIVYNATNLSLAQPVTGTESGVWGGDVNNGLTAYVDIAISGTLTLTGDGAVTLANTNGDNTATNIGSTTAQYAMIRVTGTLTTTKVITAPSYSKIYIVTNAATGGSVTIKASGQTGVSVAVGETATVYFNGTDYVKSATTTYGTGTVTAVSVASANGFAGSSSGGATPALTLSTSITGVLKGNGTAIRAATSGTDYAPATSGSSILYGNGSGGFSNVTVGSGLSFSTGTLSSTGSGGTVTSVSFTGGIISVATATTTPAFTVAGTSGGIPYFSSASTWATSAALASNALVVGGGAGAAPSTITTGTGVVTALGVNTGSAGAFVVNGGALGTPSSGTVTNLTGTASININGTVGATTATTGTFTNVQITSLGVGTAASGTSGEIRATNNITAYYSDDRLKTRLGSIEGALDKVRTLDAFYYEANQTAQDLGYDAVREVGISAQQVQSILPEVVAPAPIDDKYLTVRYERLVPLLIAAIKELEAKVKVLEAK